MLIAQASQAQTTIFDFRSAWKYLDNNTFPGATWPSTTFNDATWASDTGWFGYGDPAFVTKCVNACGTVSCAPSCGSKYITTYFRKVVNIPNIALFDSMLLNIIRDDGFVVYVNGVEVWRNNLPNGTISQSTVALTALGGADEYTPISLAIPSSFFVSGNNTIALELHQQAGSSSDLSFNMQMIGIPSPLFFDYRSAWKYLDNGSNQGTAWTATSFNDASWASDTGWFGYGDPSFVTKCVNACGTVSCSPSCGTKYITTYFRKVVSVPNTTLYDSVKMSIIRDDAVAVYVNGAEVWRCPNMPGGTLLYTTQASSAIGNAAETTAVIKTIPITSFVNGNNTIAVELHQESGTSSDLNFNMRMEGVRRGPAVNLVFGPYLQMGSQTSANVRWRTSIASKSRVMMGTTLGTYPIIVSDNALVVDHDIRVTGLMPNTKYYYRFGTDTSIIQGDSTNFFTTAPADTSTRRVTVAFFGDCGQNNLSYQTNTLNAYRNFLSTNGMKAADLMLLGGDNAYNNGTDAEFSNKFFAPYSGNILKNHILFPTPGNHDYDNGARFDVGVPYFSLFTTPTSGESGGVPSGTEAYYSYDWGNIHFLSLDSYGKGDGNTTRMFDTLGAQVTWIKADLAANTKKWVIAYWHHPPYTMTSHNSDATSELINIRQNFIRILERYGVDLILCGHSHAYERSYLMKGHYGSEASFNKAAHTTDSSTAKYDGSANSCPYYYASGKYDHGTVYVVAGSSGASGGVQGSFPHNALPIALNDAGMFFLDINDNRLDAKFVRANNTIFDQFTIMKDVKKKDTVAVFPGTPVNYSASWPGTYVWNTGATTRSNTVITPLADTMITVKDNNTGTCITDQHFIDVQCTMPVFTTCPANIVTSGCNNVVTYSVADTATPNPALSYTFSGATTASGSGTGSGSTFNVGVTNVTITATNMCGIVNCSFNVTVNPLPNAVSITGGGAVCGSTTLAASNGGTGTIYYQGVIPSGSSSAIPSTSELITSSGTYYFRAQGTDGCWGPEGTVTVTVNSIPAPVVAFGSGTFCNQATIVAGNGGSGTIYYQGMSPGGTSITTPSSSENVTASGTHYFRAQSSAGCWSSEGSVAVTVNPLPAVHTLTGGGSYCAGSTGVNISLSGSDAGINYLLYNGIMPVGGTMVGTGVVLNFGSQTSPGSYTITATNIATACSRTFGSVSVAVNSLPVAFTVTGGGSYCAGGSGVSVGLSGSETGVNYQLYNGSSAVGSAVAGTNAPIDFGLQTASGSYSVVATNATTACIKNMTSTTTVVANAVPVVYTVIGGGNYCSGGTGVHVGLSGSGTGIRYQLYQGAALSGSPVNGLGSALDFGLRAAAGTYTVVATDTVTGCANNMGGSTAVNINPLPALHTVTGGGSYCSGGSGVNVNLSSSATGINYQLYLGSATTGSPLPGTGSALSFGMHTSAGTYTVVATNASTACVSNMSGSATVNINPLPVIHSVTGGGNYCAGGTGVHIGLSGSQTGTKYYLYKGTAMSGSPLVGTGSLLDFGFRTLVGTYTVFAKDTTTTCERWMTGTGTVATIPLVFPSVSISSDKGTTACAGDFITYTAMPVNGGSAPAYQWLVNAINTSVTTNTYRAILANGDVIAVNMTSNATCAASGTPGASVVMKVDTILRPAVNVYANPGTTFNVGQNVTLNAVVNGAGSSVAYQWLLNGHAIPGATTSTYSSTGFTDNDTITCSISTGNACGEQRADRSVILHAGNVSVGTVAANSNVTVVPNPNNGGFTIKGSLGQLSHNQISLTITNVLGQVVYREMAVADNGVINKTIRLSNAISNGTYILNLNSELGNTVFHMVIER